MSLVSVSRCLKLSMHLREVGERESERLGGGGRMRDSDRFYVSCFRVSLSESLVAPVCVYLERLCY
jgi:hypothetical protein